ncbi:MAG: AI-2E family transporter [Bacteroidetes bacterium]|nr:AI-2E family transporter [Bacteroidota bacterium]
MSTSQKIPYYAKVTIFLVGIIAFVAILYIAQRIIVPIVFATIIAILLNPIVNFFTRRKVHRIVAISLTLLLTFIVIAALGALIVMQVSRFLESWPLLVEKFTGVINETSTWASSNFDVSPEKIQGWLIEIKKDLINTNTTELGQTLVSFGNGVVVVFLVPVYIFMILFYRPLLLDFVRKLFGPSNKSKVSEIVFQIKTVIQAYLVGLVIETGIVATLNTTALLILGIDYAILLGIIGSLLNLIPYIGGIVAVGMPMMVALATKSTAWYAIYVLIFYYIIQLIDNNYIVPKIVASKVKINALFSIIAVFAGGALWGMSGMFLSIPLLAIVKLIFDHIEPLKPWGFLLGDTMPPIIKLKPVFKKLNRPR